MKKMILLGVAGLLLGCMAYGQDTVRRKSLPAYVYCELIQSSKLPSSGSPVSVDFGQDKQWLESTELYNKRGKPVVFSSMVAAMNFMAADGWEFVQAYVITTEVYWVLRLNTSNLSPKEKQAMLDKLNTSKP